jgi:hypothetical protein
MFHLMLESVMLVFEYYLTMYTFFNFATAISTSKRLGSGTNGLAISISTLVLPPV